MDGYIERTVSSRQSFHLSSVNSLHNEALRGFGTSDDYLSDSESEAVTGQMAEDISRAGMTCGLAAAAGNDPELGGEKTGKRQQREEVAAECPCLCTDGGHLGTEVLA
ncbi:UNVERIFIED_CONTAM: hypothetical protein K2H54_074500 [Gekko kuhli]